VSSALENGKSRIAQAAAFLVALTFCVGKIASSITLILNLTPL